jgi:hypothetical protein
MKLGMIIFLILGLGSCLLLMRTQRWEQALEWGHPEHPLLGEKDERRLHRVTCETTRSWIHDNQERLVRIMDTPVVLSNNKWTRDELGNVGVQEGLTSR